MANKQATKKPVRVTRAFMMRLAKRIYDPKTRKFIKLCSGSLQNSFMHGTGKNHTVHCGLGELYWAMTGKHPFDTDDVTEKTVVDLAVELSDLVDFREQLIAEHAEGIKALGLPKGLEGSFVHMIVTTASFHVAEHEFRRILTDLPLRNDGGHHSIYAYNRFRSRASRVAKALRKAAALLPT